MSKVVSFSNKLTFLTCIIIMLVYGIKAYNKVPRSEHSDFHVWLTEAKADEAQESFTSDTTYLQVLLVFD